MLIRKIFKNVQSKGCKIGNFETKGTDGDKNGIIKSVPTKVDTEITQLF